MERRSEQQPQWDHNAYRRSSSSFVELFARIHDQRVLVERAEQIKPFKRTFAYVIICALFAFLLQSHNQIYNALDGPFHWNLDEFIDHLRIYNKQLSPSKSPWFSFHEEYFQVELGEDHIGIFSSFLQLIKEPTILASIHPHRLFLKLPTHDLGHFRARHSFRFESFSVRTLICIVQQCHISPTEYNTGLEKSMYIRIIKQVYDRNPTAFNKNVLIKCGILLGYLYHPKGEQNLSLYSLTYKLDRLDVAIDASYPYYPFKAFLLGGLLIWLAISTLVYLVLYLFYSIHHETSPMHSTVKGQLRQIDIDSLQSLDDLCCNSIHREQNYDDRLFLIRQKHLIILNINLNEHNACTLSQFYAEKSPFTIFLVSSIIEVDNGRCLVAEGYSRRWYTFPTLHNGMYCNEASDWLHNHLLIINGRYRHCYKERVRVQQESEARRRFTSLLAEEEEELQRRDYANNFDPLGEITSASPRFIAQFRFEQHHTVQNHQMALRNSKCTLCLEEFEIDQKYAQWPCPGQHVFHDECMLKALRSKNKCPLCRHTVEPATLPAGSDIVVQHILRTS